MALQGDGKDDENMEIEAGRFVVETQVKEQKLFVSLRDKITKKSFRSAFGSADLRYCGFNESQASKLETIGRVIQAAQAGENGLKLKIEIPQDGDGGQPGGGVSGAMSSPGGGIAKVIVVKGDDFFGAVNYKLQLNEVARDKTDINKDSIDDIKEDVNYMREQIQTLTADLSVQQQHRLPKNTIIRWKGARNNVPQFWRIYEDEDDNKDEEEAADGWKKYLYTYKSDFDENGILYAIGTNFGKREYRNPALTGQVEIRTAARMGRVSKPKEHIVGREGGIDCYINGVENNWFLINFKNRKIRPTHYTLRHDVAPTNENHLRNWQLQGQNEADGDDWDVLIEHKNDESLNEPDGTASWSIPNIVKFYQYFRLQMTETGSSNRWSICCSGFEIYGENRNEDIDNVAPVKIHKLIKIV